MDFQKQKLALALVVLSLGIDIAFVYHAWQGLVLASGYPNDTFLCSPQARFNDFTNCWLYFQSGDPYLIPDGNSVYFPSAYLFYGLFAWLSPTAGAVLFIVLCTALLYVLLETYFRELVPHPARRMFACAAVLLSFPVIYAQDRANLELLLVFLVAISLHFFRQARFGLSFATLMPAICFKLYPAVLLVFFLRRGRLRYCFWGLVGFLAVNWLALLIYRSPASTSLSNFFTQLDFWNHLYVLGDAGAPRSASAWSLFRFVFWLVHSAWLGSFQWPLSASLQATLLAWYSGLSLLVLLLLVAYLLLVETVFARKLVLVLIYMTLSAPAAGEYKLLYILLALVILILTTARRSFDLAVVVLLAFALWPKREILLPFMGKSDTNFADTSIAVIVNPLCLIIAATLLLQGGWQAAQPLRLRARLGKLATLLPRTGLYSPQP